MTENSSVRIGLLGCGARLRQVVENLLNAGGGRVSVSAVFDTDPNSINAAREAFGAGLGVSGSEDELIARRDVDWVFIGSFNCHHARQSVKALRANKHVFCEKPLAITLDDCLAVRDAVSASGRIFSFGLVLRYSPFYQKIKALLGAGAVGDLVSFEFNETLQFNHGGYIFGNWRRHRQQAGSHVLEKCCHDLDLANWLAGRRPLRVASFGGRNFFTPANARHLARIGADAQGRMAYRTWPDPRGVNPFTGGADIFDNQVVILEYAGGARATFHTNCNAAISERRFYICGTEGGLRGDLASGVIEHQRIGHDTRAEIIKTDELNAGGHGGGDEVMARGLLDTLTLNTPPLAGIDEALSASAVAFAIDEAADTGAVVDLRPTWQRLGQPMD